MQLEKQIGKCTLNIIKHLAICGCISQGATGNVPPEHSAAQATNAIAVGAKSINEKSKVHDLPAYHVMDFQSPKADHQFVTTCAGPSWIPHDAHTLVLLPSKVSKPKTKFVSRWVRLYVSLTTGLYTL